MYMNVNRRIKTLTKDNGKGEQSILQVEEQNKLKQNKIVKLKIEINTWANENKDYMEKYKIK